MSIDLAALTIQFYRYIISIVLFFGTIGSILNTIIFSRKNLRGFPCSLYYLTQSIICLFFLYTTILLRYLAESYQLDLPSRSPYTCKFYLYTSAIFRSLSALFILWATIDRYLVSSSSERLRRLSQVKYAIYTICLTIITIVILFIYVPIYFSNSTTSALACNPNGHGNLTIVYTLSISFIMAFFVPLMLVCYSILTVRNIKRRRQLVHTTNTAAQQHQNTHMIRLMLCQSFIYVILVTPISIFNLYSLYVPIQTSAQLLFTYKFLFIFQCIHPSTAFYVNTLISRTYRHEVIKTLNNVIKRVFHSTIVERQLLNNEYTQQQQRQTTVFNTRIVRHMETKF